LCFVPEEHEAQEKLPAVSGSSGHLVIERSLTDKEKAVWPGQVFAETDLPFEAAMLAYAQAIQDRLVHAHTGQEPMNMTPTLWRKKWEGRTQRHQVIIQRKQEDAEWFSFKVAWRQARQAYRNLSKEGKEQERGNWQEKQSEWALRREQQQTWKQTRQQENEAWHQRNQALPPGTEIKETKRTWIAVLVMTDNCTRQCAALPIFRTGPKVTSQEVVSALQTCLPAELQFLVSDQGKHFKTKFMSQLALEKDFVQVLTYRHRPQSNGIAERFVLTFKHWLRNCSWHSVEELEKWVSVFLPNYNDRPHQGIAIPGLSPNEFAKRIWLM
jgi:transposase InsO family protein